MLMIPALLIAYIYIKIKDIILGWPTVLCTVWLSADAHVRLRKFLTTKAFRSTRACVVATYEQS